MAKMAFLRWKMLPWVLQQPWNIHHTPIHQPRIHSLTAISCHRQPFLISNLVSGFAWNFLWNSNIQYIKNYFSNSNLYKRQRILLSISTKIAQTFKFVEFTSELLKSAFRTFIIINTTLGFMSMLNFDLYTPNLTNLLFKYNLTWFSLWVSHTLVLTLSHISLSGNLHQRYHLCILYSFLWCTPRYCT